MENLFSTKEAAEYLGMNEGQMKYHVFTAKNIKGQMIGNSMVFTKEELDRFKTTRKPQGRPRKKPTNDTTEG